MTEKPHTAFQTAEVLNMHKRQTHTSKGSNIDQFHVTKYLRIIRHTQLSLHTNTHPPTQHYCPNRECQDYTKGKVLHLRYTHKKQRKTDKTGREVERTSQTDRPRVHIKFKNPGEIQHWKYICVQVKLHNTVEIHVQLIIWSMMIHQISMIVIIQSPIA